MTRKPEQIIGHDANVQLIFEGYMVISQADYRRLVSAAHCDDTIVWCETCGAWLDADEAASNEDYTGCWKAATHDPKYDGTCRSYRALGMSKKEQ